MGKITFVSHDGESHETALVEGQSLMQIATNNAVSGIDGDCGGECGCGTCHVFIGSDWLSLTGARGDLEDQMLELAQERKTTSRLACQIKVSSAMDGMTVQLPEFQM